MTGVILFRAQPFHNGHLAQVKRAYTDMQKLGSKLYIFVGSADKYGTKRNPIPIHVRLDLIYNSLEEAFSEEDLKNIHVVALDDLSDEANNTHSWGSYLYNNVSATTKDRDFVFYYSDKPEIVLSWFDDEALMHIWFKFLPRVDDISATIVRKCLLEFTPLDHISLENYLPPYVYSQRVKLHEYIVSAE